MTLLNRRRWLPTLVALASLAALALVASCGGGSNAGEGKKHFYGPTEMAVEPFPLKEGGPLLFVINSWGGDLSIVETDGYEIVKSHKADPFAEDVLWLGPAPLDITITPTGDLVYVTDANRESVRVVEPYEPWNIRTIDLELRAARVSVAPAAIDPASYESAPPVAWERRGEVWFTDPDDSGLIVWNHFDQAVVARVALPAKPTDLQVSRDGESVFVLGEDATLYVVDAAARALAGVTVDLSGAPRRVVESPDGAELFVLNSDPPRLQTIRTDAWTLANDEVTFSADVNDMAFSTDGDLGFISAEDGYLYYFFLRTHKVCGSGAKRPYFYDKGLASNPTMTAVETENCVTREELWSVVYRQEFDAWEVEGENSGLQVNLAYTGQTYISDRGEIQFLIRAGDMHESEGDTFRVQTYVGVTPVPVGRLPRGVVTTPILDEPGEDRVFVADPSTDSVTRVLTFDTNADELNDID